MHHTVSCMGKVPTDNGLRTGHTATNVRLSLSNGEGAEE
jgi:hypothetical protein